MKLIIDIPENLYKWIKDEYDNPNEEVAYSAIENGTPVSTGGDLISREALKTAIEQGEGFSWDSYGKDDLCVRKKYIDNAPTVEEIKTVADCIIAYGDGYETARRLYERPQGEWIIVKDEKWGDNVKCPFCGKELAGTDLNFCCKCGADMRGKENE